MSMSLWFIISSLRQFMVEIMFSSTVNCHGLGIAGPDALKSVTVLLVLLVTVY